MQNSTRIQSIFRWYLCLLLFLLPLKFGWQTGCQEQANFPLNWAEWLLFTMWPEQLYWLLCAVGLGLAGLGTAFRDKSRQLAIRRSWLAPALTFLPLLAGLFGLAHTTEWNYACNWYGNGISALMLALAVYMTAADDHRLLPDIFQTMAISCLLCGLHGWYQHFGGLSANLELMKANAEAAGIELTQQLLDKLAQTRVHGTFADPNIYAAHLLLTLPILLKVMGDFGKKFSSPKCGSFFLCLLSAILIIAAIFWSGSRSAVLGIGAAAGAWLWIQYLSNCKFIVKVVAVLILCMVILGGLKAMTHYSHRDMSTASVRSEYYSTAWKMFKIHPGCGVGLGEFYPWHLALKPEGADEARDAHSQFFMMLAQCGIPGGIAAIIRLALPVFLLLGLGRGSRHADRGIFLAAVAGWLSWNVHSLFQFDDIVLATAGYVAIIPFFCLNPEDTAKSCLGVFWRLIISILAIFTIVACTILLTVQKNLEEGTSWLNAPGQYKLAKRQLTKWEILQLRSPYPWRILGDAAMAGQDFEEAEINYRQLTILTPHRASSWQRLGNALNMLGRQEEASKALESASFWYPTKHK